MKFLNFNYFFYYRVSLQNESESFSFYKYNRLNKNIFIKSINKKLKNFKEKSFNRDKQVNILNKYYNVSVYNGKKTNFFKNFNLFVNDFYFSFFTKNEFFLKKPNYINVCNLLESKESNFDFCFLLKDFLLDYSSIFDIKVSKVPKKYKLKFKKKFILELSYVYIKKRLKFTLKLINNLVKSKKKNNLRNNLFWTFSEILFDPRGSFLWKRKIGIYNRAMRKFHKKNLN